MSTIDVNVRKLVQIIEKDVLTHLSKEGERDPLGFAVYMYFLSKNGIENPASELLVEWMNSWIEGILKKGFGRFLDRNLTALLFGYYALSEANKKRVKVDSSSLVRLAEGELSRHIHRNLFFGNVTSSIVILLSLAGMNVDLEKYENVVRTVLDSLLKGTLLNDPKNAVFVAPLLEKLNRTGELRTLLQKSLDKFMNDDVFFDEKVYLAWVLWRYRANLPKDSLEVTVRVKEFVENFIESMGEENVDSEIADVFGDESTTNRYSRFLLGVALDLLLMLERDRITEIAPQFGNIVRTLRELQWDDVEKELFKAVSSYEECKFPDTCNNLRMSLMLFIAKVYEMLTGQKAPVEKGKSPNLNKLLKPLQSEGLQNEEVGVIGAVWSYLSEKAHVDKSGAEPSPEEVIFGFRLATSILDFLAEKFIRRIG